MAALQVGVSQGLIVVAFDEANDPVSVPGTPVWGTDNGTITPSADGLSATLIPSSTGTANVTCSSGGLTAPTFPIGVSSGIAVTLQIQFAPAAPAPAAPAPAATAPAAPAAAAAIAS